MADRNPKLPTADNPDPNVAMELVSIDENGNRTDAHLWEGLEDAERRVSELAVENAIADGMSPEEANMLFGYRE